LWASKHMAQNRFDLLVLLSIEEFEGMVQDPPCKAGPCETHTPGWTADQRESMRSTLEWWRKKIGSNPEKPPGQIIQKLLKTISITSKLGITHVTTDGAMNLIVYGFQRVTGATTIAFRVVAKSRPSANTRKKVVGTWSNIILYSLQITGGKSESEKLI
jgi:hypothetical protein